jgi:hypothetical protein
MSITLSNSSILYGQEAIITVSGLTNVSVTPIDSVLTIEYNGGLVLITVKPNESTLYFISGYNGAITVNLNCTVYVNVIIRTKFNTNIVNYGNNIQIGAFGSNTYKWYPSLYLNTTTGSTVIATPLNNITYTVIATDTFLTESVAKIDIIVNSNLTFTPSNPTVYEANLIEVSVSYSNFSNGDYYIWRPVQSKYVPSYCDDYREGNTIRINPYNTIDYNVSVYNNTYQGTIITSGNITITVLPKPMEVLDIDILPYRLYPLIISRNKKELIKELRKDKILSKRIIDFYYTTLQTAYRMEWTDKNGIPFKMKWLTVYQINNQNEMVISFSQQWNFFKYIQLNQSRYGMVRSNFAFLLNTLNQMYLEFPQQIYYIQN